MARLLLAALSLLGALSLAPALNAQPPSADPNAPRIVVEPKHFDFGRVLPGKTLHKDFQVRNFGSRDLEIQGVSTSCGCTAALTESRRLAPGRSSVLSVSLSTREDHGRVRRSVLIRSNDPRTPVLEISLEADVAPGSERSDRKK